jgi:hypothetical protein
VSTPNPSYATDDPRGVGGDIAGPGGPHDRDSVVFNTEGAVLVDNTTVAVMHGAEAGDLVGMLVEGRVNRSTDRVRMLLLLNGDGVAAMVTEMRSVMKRAGASDLGSDLVAEYSEATRTRLADLRAEGLL